MAVLRKQWSGPLNMIDISSGLRYHRACGSLCERRIMQLVNNMNAVPIQPEFLGETSKSRKIYVTIAHFYSAAIRNIGF